MTDFPWERITGHMRRAGEIMLRAGNIEGRADMIHDKEGSENFVTEYDTAVQKLLITEFSDAVPGCSFLAEEDGGSVGDIFDGFCFVIDPIDGTTNFIHGLNASSISVGVLCNGEPFFGAVYNPYRDEMFTAFTGGGAYLNGERIHASRRSPEHALVLVGTSPYYRDTLGDRTMAIINSFYRSCGDIRRSGSAAIDLCDIACGRADIFCELRLSPWDFTAGALIIREAGGIVTDMNGECLPVSARSSVLAAGNECYNAALGICGTAKS